MIIQINSKIEMKNIFGEHWNSRHNPCHFNKDGHMDYLLGQAEQGTPATRGDENVIVIQNTNNSVQMFPDWVIWPNEYHGVIVDK